MCPQISLSLSKLTKWCPSHSVCAFPHQLAKKMAHKNSGQPNLGGLTETSWVIVGSVMLTAITPGVHQCMKVLIYRKACSLATRKEVLRHALTGMNPRLSLREKPDRRPWWQLHRDRKRVGGGQAGMGEGHGCCQGGSHRPFCLCPSLAT